ncbi:hypothetical protein ANN_16943 [Periplaneta americana]|uniref:Uncharacterized protein n=1 Tax=Periplaneta americana TaxID=6978 RepID=A0ABQ8SRI9_PERAM|nr:hypothetical protein ANN_16943 [Periplaneta americana]
MAGLCEGGNEPTKAICNSKQLLKNSNTDFSALFLSAGNKKRHRSCKLHLRTIYCISIAIQVDSFNKGPTIALLTLRMVQRFRQMSAENYFRHGTISVVIVPWDSWHEFNRIHFFLKKKSKSFVFYRRYSKRPPGLKVDLTEFRVGNLDKSCAPPPSEVDILHEFVTLPGIEIVLVWRQIRYRPHLLTVIWPRNQTARVRISVLVGFSSTQYEQMLDNFRCWTPDSFHRHYRHFIQTLNNLDVDTAS